MTTRTGAEQPFNLETVYTVLHGILEEVYPKDAVLEPDDALRAVVGEPGIGNFEVSTYYSFFSDAFNSLRQAKQISPVQRHHHLLLRDKGGLVLKMEDLATHEMLLSYKRQYFRPTGLLGDPLKALLAKDTPDATGDFGAIIIESPERLIFLNQTLESTGIANGIKTYLRRIAE